MLPACLLVLTSTVVLGQRPSFAGTRPIGYPDTPNRTTTEGLDNRFGDGTTERLPLEANGDRDLVDRLSKLPIDSQPFWFINWQALEAMRKNPQTYPQRPNVFAEPIPSNNMETTTATPLKNRTQTLTTSVTTTANNYGNLNVSAANSIGGNPNPQFVETSTQQIVQRASFPSLQERWDSNGALSDRFGISASNATTSNTTKPLIQ